MEYLGDNIPLSEEDIKKIKKILSEKQFRDFKIDKYYFRDKFTGVITKEPRHGIALSELKNIFKNKRQIFKNRKIQK